MTVEWMALSGVVGVAGFGLAYASFWMTFGGRLAKAEADSAAALQVGREALDKMGIQAAANSLYREQVAREYIHREVMREVEDRLTQAIDRLGDRLDRFTEAAIQNR